MTNYRFSTTFEHFVIEKEDQKMMGQNVNNDKLRYLKIQFCEQTTDLCSLHKILRIHIAFRRVTKVIFDIIQRIMNSSDNV